MTYYDDGYNENYTDEHNCFGGWRERPMSDCEENRQETNIYKKNTKRINL